ncbi:MAG TPA: ABC transporter ATP-binding protein [Candidatus Angelobacter sp.]|nr:ABC transporter ATP-binding protein [Candidatus Angelobacter sp.]
MAETAEKPKKTTRQQLKSVMPQIWELIRPRRFRLAIGFVLLAISRVTGLALPYSSRILLDRVIPRKDVHLLTLLVVGVVLASIIQGITSYALTQLLSKDGQRAIAELRRKVQAHVARLSVSYYDSTKSGVLVSRIMSDVEGVRNIIGTGLMEFAGGVLTAAIVLVWMIKISYLMTSIAVGALILFSLVLKKAFKTIRPIFRERGKLNAEVTGRLTESLGGVRVVKGYHAEEREHHVFSGGVEKLLQNVLNTLTAMSTMGLASTLVMGSVGAVIMFIGGKEMMTGHMTQGQFFQYTLFMGFLAAPVMQITNIGSQITEAVAGLDRTREIFNEQQEHADPERTIALPEIQGRLEFEHVDFEYEAGKPVLEDVSFTSVPGSVTALVGSSGSGKSTIIGLVAAFHKPTHGSIHIDGQNLSKVRLDSYRPRLGVVLQESFLFAGTIRENIVFARPDAAEEEILRACHIAHVDEFAEKFKDKYDTVIGERGVKLSGGQRQRVSIARAVLADPRILILDEATSSLDSESEAFIQQGLKYLMKGRTTFVIAHRLSTIRQADQILVVEAGKIVERGTHESLYTLKGRYFDLYTRQHGLESNLLLAPGEGGKPIADEQPGAGRAANEPTLDPVGLVRGQSF